MLAIFQDHLDAIESYLPAHHFRSLDRVLAGWSVNCDAWAVLCCDGARAILSKPISDLERQCLLHDFICDSVP